MSKSTPSAIPGVDMMTDTLDFFKNMWENVPGMNMPGMKHIPGMVMPTLSVDEIEKQIKDLKAVESWLSLNLNMLHTTIQALEVQKATISTLQTMGENFTAAMQPMAMPDTEEKSVFQSPFAAAFTAMEKPAAHEKPAARNKPAAADQYAMPPAMEQATAAMADAMQPLANPAAWWGMLQDQFKQAVDTAAAMTPEVAAADTPSSTRSRTARKATAKAPAEAAPGKRKSPSRK